MIEIFKIYRNAKKDKKGRDYQLINIISSDQKRYTIFEYGHDTDSLQDGDHFDDTGYEKQANEYQGKTSYILSKPKKANPQQAELLEKVAKLEERLNNMAAFLKSKFPNG